MEEQAWNAVIDAVGVTLLHRMQKLISVADRSFSEAAAVQHEILTEVKQGKRLEDCMSAMLYPIYADSAAKQAGIQARMEVTRTAAAILLWKAKHGAFPRTLQEALSAVPADPFDGKPLKYRREGQGFVVYSVGTTGKFDGDTPDKKPASSDAVFRYPLPPYSKVEPPAAKARP